MIVEAEPLFRALTWNGLRTSVLVPLVCIVGMGTFLRFFGLGFQSLWLDEAVTWYTSGHLTINALIFADKEFNFYPPAYNLLIAGTRQLIGDSEWALRLPSAIFGALSIPLMFAVGTRLFNPGTGLISSGLMATLLFSVYYGQEARPYAIILFLTLAMILAWTYFHDAMRAETRPTFACLGAMTLSGFVLAYMHYFGLLFVFFLGTVTFILHLRKPKSLIWSVGVFVFMAFTYVPWLPTMWEHLSQTKIQTVPPSHNIAMEFYYYIVALFMYGANLTWSTHVVASLVIVAMLVALGRAVVGYTFSASPAIKRRILIGSALLGTWLLAPFFFAYFKSVNSSSIYSHRNLIVSFPAVLLIVAQGIPVFPVARYGRVVLGTLVVVLACARILTSGYYTQPHKEQYREAVASLIQSDASSPVGAVVASSWNPFPYDYYLKQFDSPLKIDLVGRTEKEVSALVQIVEESRTPYIWYFISQPGPEDAFVNALRDMTQVREERKWRGVQTYLLELNPAGLRAILSVDVHSPLSQ